MSHSHTHRARKRYGQHFLQDRETIRKILNAIVPDKRETVIEIGPGLGALTSQLVAMVDTLHVIEIDKDVIPGLKKKCGDSNNLHIHNTDALTFDFCSVHESKIRVTGNLPYNISTPLLFHLLGHSQCISEMIFMLQKEVVNRICAEKDTSDYGRLSVMLQTYCQVEYLFDVPPTAFSPVPKVNSAMLRIHPYDNIGDSIDDRTLFSDIVRLAFSHRRKTLRNALKDIIDNKIFEKTGIDPRLRPQNLSVQEFVSLANELHRANTR